MRRPELVGSGGASGVAEVGDNFMMSVLPHRNS